MARSAGIVAPQSPRFLADIGCCGSLAFLAAKRQVIPFGEGKQLLAWLLYRHCTGGVQYGWERLSMQTVKDLSVEELRAVIGEVVEEKLREILNDPDAGLTLRPEIQERLRRDLQEPQEEGQNIPAAELARRRGLDW